MALLKDLSVFGPTNLISDTFVNNIYANGNLKWSGSSALPEQTNPQYFLVMDAFADGGTTKWTSKANLLTILSNEYVKKTGDTMSGALTINNDLFVTDHIYSYGNIIPMPTGNPAVYPQLGIESNRWRLVSRDINSAGNIIPAETDMYQLGTDPYRWKQVVSWRLNIHDGAVIGLLQVNGSTTLLNGVDVTGDATISGDIYSSGFHHTEHNNDDAILLAGGGYTLITNLINTGTANRMAYYSTASKITSASKIETDGNYIHIINDTDVSGSGADTSAPFTIGTLTGTHISMNSNEILAKTSATASGTLYLQDNTGTVQVAGTGGLIVNAITIGAGASSTQAGRTISSSSTLYLNSGSGTSIIFNKAGSEMARFDTSSNFIPSANNTRNLGLGGSSAKRWKALYIGTADSYGSQTQAIFWNYGVPTPITYTIGSEWNPVYFNEGIITETSYHLESTVRPGSANKMAFYKNNNEICPCEIYVDNVTNEIKSNGGYIHIINNTDIVANTADTSAPFTIGTLTGTHIAMDSNEILAKTNGTTLGTLYLQNGNAFVQMHKINLNRAGNAAYGRIYYYDSAYFTWVDYMSNSVASGAPTGGQPSTTTEVSSWAKRSLIENTSGYGWIWEACSNAAASASSTKPTARMSLSSNTGQLRIEANAATTAANNKGGLIVSSALNGSSGNVAIELWRGTNASWSISIESGDLHIRDNYTTSVQTTFLHDNIKILYNSGTVNTKLIQPFTTNTYDLGTTSLRWRKLYTLQVDIDSNTAGAVPHINFNRASYNYINIPTDGSFVVSVNGAAAANTRFKVTNTAVTPGDKDNTVTLGSTNYYWSHIYTKGNVYVKGTGNFLGSDGNNNNIYLSINGKYAVLNNGENTFRRGAGTESENLTLGTSVYRWKTTYNIDEYIGTASGSQCHLNFDNTNKCLRFTFD